MTHVLVIAAKNTNIAMGQYNEDNKKVLEKSSAFILIILTNPRG